MPFGVCQVAVSDESDLLLETGGGLRRALHLLGTDPVITMNPDVVWTGPNPVAELRAAWDGARMDALLMLVAGDRAEGRVGGGDFALAADGRIARRGDLVFGGAQIIRGAAMIQLLLGNVGMAGGGVNAWPFVAAAYAVTLGGAAILSIVSYLAMRRAEK